MAKDNHFAQLSRRLQAADGYSVVYGIMPEPHPSGMNADELAEILRRGTRDGHIPARDFVAVVEEDMKVISPRLLRRAVKDIMRGRSPRRALGRLRLAAFESLVKAIDTFYDPENAPATIRKKGRDDPLVDGGDLLAAADAIIED